MLVVGAQRVLVTCDPADNECLLRTYLDLVAKQRRVALDTTVHLRTDDIAVLAELLDLDDDALEARLRRMLRLSERQATALARRLRRTHLAAALGLGMFTVVPSADALADTDGAAAPPVRIADAEVDLEPPAAPVDIGTAVRYERDPAFVAPPGVDIGDAMVIERDPPPAR